jgi:hypothetical protein
MSLGKGKVYSLNQTGIQLSVYECQHTPHYQKDTNNQVERQPLKQNQHASDYSDNRHNGTTYSYAFLRHKF